MSTRVSRSIAGSGISPYFGIDTHRYTLVLRFICRLPQNSPEILLLLSWTAFTGTNGRKQLYLRNGATYKNGTCTVVLQRTSTFY